MFNVFIVLEVIGITIIFVAMALLITSDGAREQKLMSHFLCGSLIQNVGYLLEMTAATPETAVMAIKVEYLGSMFVPLCYCYFMYCYCYRKAPDWLMKLLAIVDGGLLVLIFCLERHSLYYRDYKWMESAGGHHYLSIEYGPGYPVFLIFGCIIPYALSIIVLLRAIIERPEQAANRRYKTIMYLSLLPVLALLSYAGKLTQAYDLTPAVLGIMLSTVVILIWRRRTFDFRRLASDVVLNSMGDGVISLDSEKKIQGYNLAAAEIFPELNADFLGNDIAQVAGFEEGLKEEKANQKFSLRGRYYESHVKQITDGSGSNQGYVVLVLDVTDTRNYIEEIKKVREQAEKANMAKSEFLANMSHEIRTPMNAIIGLSDIIMEESRGLKMYFYASDIKSASQNLLSIINDILDLSKVEAGKMELVTSDYYVKSLVNEVVNMMDIAASQHGLLLKYEYDNTIPCQYHGDVGRIRQILINLLNNAVKFTKEGYVRITLNGRPGKGEDEELLIFRIEDTGCGIKEEDQEKIFEDFKQADSKRNRSAEGTGLGLSITRHLVQLMNGTIELKSVYGEGTVFTVTIPQRIVDRRTLTEVPDVPAREVETVDTFLAKGCRVLVVDDNLINRKVAKGFLKSYQFDLSEAVSGFEAIDLVKKTKFDLIFMDHMMPEMDGIEAVKIIREECGENGRSPVIIALTANAMEGVREKFLSCGFQDFLAKPLDRKRLNEVLLRWIPESARQKAESREDQQPGENKLLSIDDIRIKGIEGEAVMRHQSGTLADYQELLQLYCMDGRRKLALLKELYEKKDYKNYQVEVHALKSASANIGAMKLSAAAREHEEAALRGDTEYINRHFAELTASYEKQLKYIEEALDKGKDKEESEEGAYEALDKDVLAEKLKEALELLSSFHSRECQDRIEALLKYRLPEDVGEKLKEIKEQLGLYEDDAAEALLKGLLHGLTRG